MILDCYTHGFAQACRKAGGWYGLDLFAGTGKNYSTTRLQEMRGSPLILLEAAAPRANKVLFSELDPGTLDALRARCEPYGERACIFPAGDANQLVHEMLAQVPVMAPTFALPRPGGRGARVADRRGDRPPQAGPFAQDRAAHPVPDRWASSG